MPLNPPPPDECANCGAAIPRHAKACPECGADERTGWRETNPYDGLDLPAEAFEDDESPPDAKRSLPPPRVNGIAWYWWAVGIALLVLLVVSFLGLA